MIAGSVFEKIRIKCCVYVTIAEHYYDFDFKVTSDAKIQPVFLNTGGEDLFFYYIHTEKYSPKSYVVNFRTQISSSQSEERTMVFTREKNDTSDQNRERCFFMCEKIGGHRGV